MCLKYIELCDQNMLNMPGSMVNMIEETYDNHITSTEIFTLTMHEIFKWVPKWSKFQSTCTNYMFHLRHGSRQKSIQITQVYLRPISWVPLHWPGAQTSLQTADPPSPACCTSHPGCREQVDGTSNFLPWGQSRRSRPLHTACARWPRMTQWAGCGFCLRGAGWVSQWLQAWATQRLRMWR